MFPPARHTGPGRCSACVSATALAATCFIFGAATAAADDDPPPPPLHNVQYTVWAEQPFNVEIYYRDTDPPNWADYSHNPYVFSPKVEADVGPNQQWNLDVGLANPDEWAMVVAGTGGESDEETQHPLCARRRRRGRRDQSGP